MDALELKAKCYDVLNEIAATGQTVIITKDGKPFVELVPHGQP
jgi:prevent-host-death family protein